MLMQKRLYKKVLILGIIALFVGASVIPSTIGTFEKMTTFSHTNYPGYIQDLIDNANPGDTIYIPSGTYYENIIINKSISLIGEDKDTTIIDGRGNGTVIYICAKDVNVSCFTIQNGNPAIDIKNSESAVVTGNNVRSWDTGIKVEGSDFCLCENNNISKNIYGIFLTRAHNNIITGNIISNNRRGIYLRDARFNFILKNNFIDNDRDAFYSSEILDFTLRTNRWWQNYWNGSRLLPKPIFGEIYWITFEGIPPKHPVEHHLPWFPKIDWHPALKPYDI